MQYISQALILLGFFFSAVSSLPAGPLSFGGIGRVFKGAAGAAEHGAEAGRDGKPLAHPIEGGAGLASPGLSPTVHLPPVKERQTLWDLFNRSIRMKPISKPLGKWFEESPIHELPKARTPTSFPQIIVQKLANGGRKLFDWLKSLFGRGPSRTDNPSFGSGSHRISVDDETRAKGSFSDRSESSLSDRSDSSLSDRSDSSLSDRSDSSLSRHSDAASEHANPLLSGPIPEKSPTELDKIYDDIGSLLAKPAVEKEGSILSVDKISQQFKVEYEKIHPPSARPPDHGGTSHPIDGKAFNPKRPEPQLPILFESLLDQLRLKGLAVLDFKSIAEEMSHFRSEVSKGLNKALERTTSGTYHGAFAARTPEALKQFDSQPIIVQLTSKINGFIKVLDPEQQNIIVSALSSNPLYKKALEGPQDAGQKLQNLITNRFSETTDQELKAFIDSQAGDAKTKAINTFQDASRSKQVLDHHLALKGMTPEALLAKLPQDNDLARAFYDDKALKLLQSFVEPLNQKALQYLKETIEKSLDKFAKNPQDFKVGYETALKSLEIPERPGLFKNILAQKSGVHLNPDELTQRLRTGPPIKEQIMDVLENNKVFPKDLNIQIAQAAAVSPSKLSEKLTQVSKDYGQNPQTKQLISLVNTVQNNANSPLPLQDFLKKLSLNGLLSVDESRQLDLLLTKSKRQYLDKIRDFDSDFFYDKIVAKILLKADATLDPEKEKKVFSQTLEALASHIEEDLRRESNSLVTPRALEDGSTDMEKILKLYTRESLDEFLEKGFYETHIPVEYGKARLSTVIPPIKRIPKIPEAPLNEALGKQFLDTVQEQIQKDKEAYENWKVATQTESIHDVERAIEKEPEHVNTWKKAYTRDKISGTKTYAGIDFRIRYFARYPLKLDDPLLKGSRFEKMDADTVYQINTQAKYFDKNWKLIYSKAFNFQKSEEAVEAARKALGRDEPLIAHFLEDITSRYRYDYPNHIWVPLNRHE
ncbi:hypothetical protein O181_044149 [Austropuccinia psidii MF-1]|uniref:Uncharacterized protein n=1 Tax=Austropuccinia psidii MF-1 TaxID=1389203 RepID=A0A9Q3DJQ7_9BASI|nr:hypothetical protein [Austropuccinia psidii MF-1]